MSYVRGCCCLTPSSYLVHRSLAGVVVVAVPPSSRRLDVGRWHGCGVRVRMPAAAARRSDHRRRESLVLLRDQRQRPGDMAHHRRPGPCRPAHLPTADRTTPPRHTHRPFTVRHCTHRPHTPPPLLLPPRKSL